LASVGHARGQRALVSGEEWGRLEAKRRVREGGKERAGMEIQRQQFLNGPLARTFHQRSGSAALKENVH